MASGTLGTVLLAANTLTTLYTVPAGKTSTVNFNLVNTSASPVFVRVAISATATPTAAEWVEHGTYLFPSGDKSNSNVLERSAFVCGAGDNIVCYASIASAVACRAHGLEG
jgi:hypothetical protein